MTDDKLVIIEANILFKRTLSLKIMNDTTLKIIAAVSTILDGNEKIKFYKPGIVVLGIDKLEPALMPLYENFIKTVEQPLIIITNESAKLLHLIRGKKIEFVARPPFADTILSETAATDVCIKAKKLVSGATSFSSMQITPPQQQTNTATFGSSNFRSVYQIQGGNAKKTPPIGSRFHNLVLAIGSSTGGTEAIYAFLTKLPQDMPPILITQHMPPVFTKLYADRLNLNSSLEVREAANGDELYPGLALVAPGDLQMRLVRRGGKLAVECMGTEKVSGHCPSVDMLFETVANTMGSRAIGIILTGMGKDGAQGMLQMHNRGAYTIGQDEQSSVVYGMPKVAYELGGVDIQTTPEKMPELLAKILREKF